MMKKILPLVLAFLMYGCASKKILLQQSPDIQMQQSGSNASFRCIALKSENGARVSGTIHRIAFDEKSKTDWMAGGDGAIARFVVR